MFENKKVNDPYAIVNMICHWLTSWSILQKNRLLRILSFCFDLKHGFNRIALLAAFHFLAAL